MSKDVEATPKPVRPAPMSTQESTEHTRMSARAAGVARSGPVVSESSGSGAPASLERAQEMRAALGVRQQAEALVTEASQLRQLAAADAESMVADAERLAAELVGEARTRADQLVHESQRRADEIVGRAQAESDRLHAGADAERARMRAEVTADVYAELEADRARVDGVLADARDALRVLAPAVADAAVGLREVLDSVDGLPGLERPTAQQTEPDPAPPTPTQEAPPEVTVTDGDPGTGSEPSTVRDGDGSGDDDGARPLGWLFRNGQG